MLTSDSQSQISCEWTVNPDELPDPLCSLSDFPPLPDDSLLTRSQNKDSCEILSDRDSLPVVDIPSIDSFSASSHCKGDSVAPWAAATARNCAEARHSGCSGTVRKEQQQVATESSGLLHTQNKSLSPEECATVARCLPSSTDTSVSSSKHSQPPDPVSSSPHSSESHRISGCTKDQGKSHSTWPSLPLDVRVEPPLTDFAGEDRQPSDLAVRLAEVINNIALKGPRRIQEVSPVQGYHFPASEQSLPGSFLYKTQQVVSRIGQFPARAPAGYGCSRYRNTTDGSNRNTDPKQSSELWSSASQGTDDEIFTKKPRSSLRETGPALAEEPFQTQAAAELNAGMQLHRNFQAFAQKNRSTPFLPDSLAGPLTKLPLQLPRVTCHPKRPRDMFKTDFPQHSPPHNNPVPRSVGIFHSTGGLVASSTDTVKFLDARYRRRVMDQLIDLATAFATGQTESADKLLLKLRKLEDPRGVSLQRALHYMLRALVHRFKGSGQMELSLMEPILSISASLGEEELNVIEVAQRGLHNTQGRFKEVALTETLKQALAGIPKVHVIVLTQGLCIDWGDLFQHLIQHNPKTLPQIRVSFLVPSAEAAFIPQLGVAYAALGHDVTSAATPLGLRVRCHLAVVRPQDLNPGLVDLDPSESVAVASWNALQLLPDSSVLKHNPRDTLLKWIASLSPVVFSVVEVDANYNTPFFLSRFGEVVRTLELGLEWMDLVNGVSDKRAFKICVLEAKMAVDLMNCVACEGLSRYERAESLVSWRDRMRKLGFREKSVGEHVLLSLRSECLYRGLSVEDVDGFVSLRRDGSPMLFLGTWN